MYFRVLKFGKKRYIEYHCDQCGKTYTKVYQKIYLDPTRLTFCSTICSTNSKKSGGIMDLRRKKVCLEKYGTEYASSSEKVKEKRQKTCLKKYGTKNVFQSREIKEKIKVTVLKKYNVINPSQIEEVKEKKKRTCLSSYGVVNPSQSEVIKEKKRKKNFESFGVEYLLQSQEIRNKVKKTWLKKYGVDNPLKSKEIRSKFNNKEISQKRHQTMKQNGTYGKSKIEDKFYDYLCEKLGKENVERQVRVHEWNIDFYIASNKIYIQFDGMYWHGLNRPIKMIKESTALRDKVIYQTFLRDEKQNIWFEENKLNLVRITDKEFKKELFDKNEVHLTMNQ